MVANMQQQCGAGARRFEHPDLAEASQTISMRETTKRSICVGPLRVEYGVVRVELHWIGVNQMQILVRGLGTWGTYDDLKLS